MSERVKHRVINVTNEVKVPKDIIDNVIKYCEHQSVYDKLGEYGDFYYKLKQLINS